jgi:HAE1 family hydrophobic/amphiphilic exporter-1
LFRELALVVVFSLLVSLIVSLSLVPMLASKISQVNQSHQGNQGQAQNQGSEMLSAFKAWADRSQTALEDRYEVALQAVLNWRLTTICLTLLLFGASLGLISQLGTEFMPPSDEGEVSIRGKFESGLKLSEADRLSHQVEEIIFGVIPEYQASVTTVSASGRRGNAESTVSLQINLGPSAQRTLSNSEVATQVSQKLLGQIPGAKMSVRAPQGQFLLERLLRSGDGIVIEVRGRDLKVLAELANRAKEAIKNIDGISDVDDDIEVGVPQINLSIDREKVADVGLSVRDVAEALEGAVRGRSVGDYRPVGDSIPLRLQLHDVEHLPLKVLLQQGLPTPSGEWVMLKHLIKTEQSSGPARILRKDQQRAVTVSVDVLNRPMGTVAKEIEQRLTEIALPVGYDMRVVGSYEEQSRAFDDLIISFLLALLLVYMVLACQYESLRDPLIVMFSVPVSAIGVLVTLFLTDTTLNLQSGIGCIMLGGIVVNNAILLVDQAKQLRQEGWLKGVAIVEAGRRRLRPILMTTATTVLGLLPLAFGVGEGADAQAPLARAVVGGLMASTMITLLLIPVIYDCFHSDQESTSTSSEDPVPEELS